MQRIARDHVQRILAEQQKINHDLESKKRQLDWRTRELGKREVLTERERQKLEEDKQQARRALSALKGLVRFRALVRGHAVIKGSCNYSSMYASFSESSSSGTSKAYALGLRESNRLPESSVTILQEA